MAGFDTVDPANVCLFAVSTSLAHHFLAEFQPQQKTSAPR
jgi:hypothetical protein